MSILEWCSAQDRLALVVVAAIASLLGVAGVDAHQQRDCCGHHHHHGCVSSCGSCADCREETRHNRAETTRGSGVETCSFLLDNRRDIRRTVVQLPDGVEVRTETDDLALVEPLREHVVLMAARAQGHRLSPPSDPLFAELLRNVDTIVVVHERTPQGIRVAETSRDPYVARLIQAYAEVVTLILQNGPREAAKRHPVPAS